MVTNNNTEKTLKISKEVHTDLVDLGMKGDSFDTIIRRLIAFKKLSSDKEVRKVEAKIKSEYEGKV